MNQKQFNQIKNKQNNNLKTDFYGKYEYIIHLGKIYKQYIPNNYFATITGIIEKDFFNQK